MITWDKTIMPCMQFPLSGAFVKAEKFLGGQALTNYPTINIKLKSISDETMTAFAEFFTNDLASGSNAFLIELKINGVNENYLCRIIADLDFSLEYIFINDITIKLKILCKENEFVEENDGSITITQTGQTIYQSQKINKEQIRGIVSISKTSTSGLIDTYTIFYSDGSSSSFNITNGENGGGDMYKSTYDTNNSGKVDEAEAVEWDGVQGKPSTYPPDPHTHPAQTVEWDGVQGKPSTYPPSPHGHNLNDLNEKSYNSLTDKPTQKQPIYFKRYLPLEGVVAATAYGLATSYSGTATAKTPANTNAYTRMPNTMEFLQATASATTVAYVWGTVLTGVFLEDGQETKFSVTAGVATGASNASHRFALGIAQALVTTDIDPSTITNCILLGYDKTDTNVQIMHNDGGGVCTKIDTGWSKPSADRTNVFTLQVWTEDKGITWNYRAQNWTTNETLAGIITTDVPTATGQFIAGAYIGAGAVSAVKGLGIGSLGIDGYIL